MQAALVLLAFSCVAAFTETEKLKVNPIRKITGLMENMQKEIADQQAKDQALYDNFMCFCDNGAADLLKTASDAEAANKAAAAQLEADTAEKAQLEGDIKTHESDLAGATKDLEEATNIRDKSKAEFDATVATKKASEGALGKAIPAIEKGMGGAALMEFVGAAAFKQIKRAIRASQQVTGGNRQSITSFLQGEAQAPGSGEILGMLKSMKDELSRDIAQLEKDEASAVAGFTDMKASKEKEVEFADESIESKKERVGTLAVEIVKNKDAVEDTAAEAAAAKKFAATLEKQCATKKKEFAEISKMRADETAAIGEAIGILTDDDALDVFKKSIPAAALVQAQPDVRSGFGGHRNMFTGEMSFLQAKKKPAQVLQKAMAIISQVSGAKKAPGVGLMFMSLKSKMRLAQKVSAEGAVDFGEIFKMIDEMIAILTKDNKDDAAQKDFCIAELTKTEAEKAATDDKLSSLASSIEETTDGIATAAETIKSLQEGVAALDKDVAEATEQRKKEHEEFSETLKLSEVALELIAKAKNRLQKFYNPTLYKAPPKKEMTMEEKIISAGSSALVQQEAAFDAPGAFFAQIRMLRTTSSKVAPPEAPAAPGPFKKSEKSGGVMALMDMIMGELKTSATESKMEEKYAQKDYVELMEDSKESRATDLKSLTEAESSKADLEGTLTEAKENQMLTLEQSQNVIATLAKLHGSCDFIIKNFELRLNARTAEIEGLKTAKAVLAGANFS